MDRHDPVHYGLHTLAGGAVVALAVMLAGKPSIDAVSPVYHADSAALSGVALTGALNPPVNALTAPNPFRAQGGTAVEEPALDAHEGIWVSPDTPASHAIADGLATILGDPVRVVNDRDRAEIAVGFPFHKGAR